MDKRQEIDHLNHRAWDIRNTDLNTAHALASEALALTRTIDYPAGMAFALHILAWIHNRLGQSGQALKQALEARVLARQIQDRERELALDHTLGMIYFYLEDHPEALATFLEGLQLARELNDARRECMFHIAIGAVHSRQRNYTAALEATNRVFAIADRIPPDQDRAPLADAYNNTAYYYHLQGKDAAGLELAHQGLALYEALGRVSGRIEALNTVGVIYAGLHDYDKAFMYLNQGLTLSRELDARFNLIDFLREIAQLHQQQGDTARALDELHQALEVATEINAPLKASLVHERLAAIYKAQGDYAQALAHHEQFHALHTQVFNEKSDQRLKNMQVVHDLETAFLTTEALEKEIEERERAIADLDSYASMVAHDLKNPITIITGFSELLLNEFSAQLTPDARESVQTIYNAGQTMEKIVHGLLEMARLRQEAFSPQPLDMQACLDLALKRVKPFTKEKAVRWHLPDALPDAVGHPTWVEEIWVNYLSNALKYGGSAPEITIGATPLDNGLIRYWVQDQGDGIPPAVQPRLFTRFSQLANGNRDGHGLGLSIVKTIVDKLGGTVAVDSGGIPGEGSTFSFTLPAAPAEAETDATPTPTTGA